MNAEEASLYRSMLDLRLLGDYNREVDRQWDEKVVHGRGVETPFAAEQSECPKCGWSDYHVREALGYRCTWCRAVFTDEETNQ